MQFLDLAGVKRIKQYIDDSIVNFITNSVSNLTNYYLKSETYTKSEVEALIAAINQFHYETAASTSAVSSPANNVLYLIGPTGTGEDKYEEYVYSSSNWVKIGDTSINLSGFVTIQALNTALADYTNTTTLNTLLAGKQDTIADLSDIRIGSQNNVKYTSQSLTDTQKEQARTNIGAGTYTKPSTGIPASDLADGVVPGDFIVQITSTYDSQSDSAVFSTTTTYTELSSAYTTGKRIIASISGEEWSGDVVMTYVWPTDGESSSYFTAIFTSASSDCYPEAIFLTEGSNDEIVVTINSPDYELKPFSSSVVTNSAIYYGIHPIVATAIVSAQNITPNRYHRFGTITGSITFALATPSDSSIMNHYYWTFTAGSTAPTITWPSGISWFGGSAPTITAGKHYDVSILDNIAVCMEV